MTLVVLAFAIIAAYLFGAVPVGVLVARTYGIDITKVGSGNPGATNVLRSTGWGPALVVFAFDAFKGGLAVLVARAFEIPNWQVALVALAAVLGHNYSVFLGFRGGKGVATSLGTLFVIDPGLGLGVLALSVITILVTRFVSAGSVVGAASSVVLCIAMNRYDYRLVVCAGLGLLIAIKHRDNLARMYDGFERRVDERVPRPKT
ncbi:MAG TPA: glycerol-3-phosphate 1-O-acyltransferase PlsY [Deinococcales bacterium]|nr:glycerol-3-phosphate 1-O-acyltransferase PlsY [Deinococcales bacterium]